MARLLWKQENMQWLVQASNLSKSQTFNQIVFQSRSNKKVCYNYCYRSQRHVVFMPSLAKFIPYLLLYWMNGHKKYINFWRWYSMHLEVAGNVVNHLAENTNLGASPGVIFIRWWQVSKVIPTSVRIEIWATFDLWEKPHHLTSLEFLQKSGLDNDFVTSKLMGSQASMKKYE